MKFRVYDKQEKKYINGGWFYMNPNGNLFCKTSAYLGGGGKPFPIIEPCDPDRYVVQFSTGLKDKNGKEIFEGDHVRWTNSKHYWEAIIKKIPNNETNTLYAVETYHNCTSDDEGRYYTYIRSDSRAGIWNQLEFIDKSIEIIGNIFDEVNNEQM